MTDDRWRKVSEEMPPLMVRVIAYSPLAGVDIAYVDHVDERDDLVWSIDDEYTHPEVTHWRPLPAPPAA